MGAIVKVRNVKLGDGMPKICIPVTDTNLDDLKKSVNLIRNTPFDLIEWRTPVWKIPKSGPRQ
jgi:3-dehydroquinate dehydratase-1